MKKFFLNCFFGLVGGSTIFGGLALVIKVIVPFITTQGEWIVSWVYGITIIWLLYILGNRIREDIVKWRNK